MTSRKRSIEDIARKFQRDMQKSGLGVTFTTDQGSNRITSWCPECNHVALGDVEQCPKCGGVTVGESSQRQDSEPA